MDVNIATDVKGYGAPAVASVEIEDAQKSTVAPVPPSADASSAKLDRQALHGDRTAQEQKSDGQIDPQEMEKVVAEVQTRMDAIGSKLQFGIHKHADVPDLVVQITDRDSGDLIKQFPAEEVIQIRAKLNDLMGLLFDKQV